MIKTIKEGIKYIAEGVNDAIVENIDMIGNSIDSIIDARIAKVAIDVVAWEKKHEDLKEQYKICEKDYDEQRGRANTLAKINKELREQIKALQAKL